MMIHFSKIDDKLSIYKENKVVLFGAGQAGREIKQELEQNSVRIACFIDNDPKKWGTEIGGVPVLSPEHLNQECGKGMVVQIACAKDGKAIERLLQKSGVQQYITYSEYNARISWLYLYRIFTQENFEMDFLCKLLENCFQLDSLLEKRRSLQFAYRAKQLGADSYNIICLPPKTGNHTLRYLTARWTAIRCVHTLKNVPAEIERLLCGKKKRIVTAVRENISQNLSIFFQINTHFGLNPEYWEAGGNVQTLFNWWIEHALENKDVGPNLKNGIPQFIVPDFRRKKEGIDTYLMQDFFEKNFEPYSHIDVFQYPFDKEKGYTIINVEGQNTEIFIYQLERLNDIADELGRFLGIEDFHLVNGNVGEEKWYADAYRQAKKEIKFPRAYFDACFNSRVMTHFYSDADIEKFKQRWLPHVEG